MISLYPYKGRLRGVKVVNVEENQSLIGRMGHHRLPKPPGSKRVGERTEHPSRR